jgi:hypothetical protein
MLLSTDADGRWHPGIGDPTPLGWVTVIAYLAAAFAAFRASFLSRAQVVGVFDDPFGERDRRAVARFWAAVGLCMIALGINKQLDLQTFFTEALRSIAMSQGWYEDRRRYQIGFIVGLALGGSVALALVVFALRRVFRYIFLGATGLALITGFVLVRAASFHHVDQLLGSGRIRLNWVLELSGIAVVLVAALRARVPHPVPAVDPPRTSRKNR